MRPTSFRRVQPPADDSDELESQHDDDVQVPMNEEIKHDDEEFQNQQMDSQELKQQDDLKEYGPGIANEALNPRSYAFVPSNWTRKIRAAGQATDRSEALGHVMHFPNAHEERHGSPLFPHEETTITNLDDYPQHNKENANQHNKENVANCLVW